MKRFTKRMLSIMLTAALIVPVVTVDIMASEIQDIIVDDNLLFNDQVCEDTPEAITSIITNDGEGEDVITEYSINGNVISFDTSRGPYFSINFVNKEIIQCTSDGARLIDCYISGNTLTVTVTSDEYPGEHTYTFNMDSESGTEKVELKSVSLTKSYEGNNIRLTAIPVPENADGVTYVWESSDTSIATVDNGLVTIVGNGTVRIYVVATDAYNNVIQTSYAIYSQTDPTPADDEDTVESYEIDEDNGTITFDTTQGPEFVIDYKNKALIRSSSISGGARLIDCSVEGNILTVIVTSNEYPGEHTYTFEFQKNEDKNDIVDYYEIDEENGILKFDTENGPYFKIDYINKRLIESTTLVGTAQLLDCSITGNELTVTVTSGEYPGEHTYSFNLGSKEYYDDIIDYYEINKSRSTIEFDTAYGPYFKINYNTKKILDCSSSNPRLISCVVSGSKLTLTVTSDEFSGEHTYIFDMNAETFVEDTIEYYEIDQANGSIEFDTVYGPLFVIDYKNNSILDCTSDNARLLDCSINENKLILTVTSDEFPGEHTYSFTLGSEQYYEDTIDYYDIDQTNGTIEFDTEYGPLFKIDYLQKSILECTSDNPKLLSCYIAGNKLNITVTSDEFPGKHTYTFDMATTVYNTDPIDFYEIDSAKGILEFDTENGPCFKIDYEKKQLISSSTLVGTAKLLDCSLVGNRLTVTVTSGEYPGEHTYSFNINKEAYYEDTIDYYEIDSANGTIEFDTEYGPMFKIDYNRKQIIECSSDQAELRSCYLVGNKLTVIVSSEEYPGEHTYSFDMGSGTFREDTIDYFEIDEENGILEFDTENGPYFKIDYKNKILVESSTTEGTASLLDCSVTGNKLTVTVTSGEYPGNHTYSFNLNSSTFYEDTIESYEIDTQKNTIVFDTNYGPEFKINYANKKIILCSSDNARLIKCYIAGNKLTITVSSDEFPGEHTYVFDMNVKNYINDELDYYDIDTNKGTLTFDTSMGPEFTIDYKNKKLVECSSDGAKLLECYIQGNNLIVTVTSEELPGDHTYIFNMVTDEYRREVVTSYEIDDKQGILEFETDKGSYFKIDYNNKILMESSLENAKLLSCYTPGQTLTVTVSNDSSSAARTYSFALVKEDPQKEEDFKVVLLEGDEYTYIGTHITPAIAVTYNGKSVVEGKDYTIKYTNNLNAGKGKITVTGKGNLSGSESKVVSACSI